MGILSVALKLPEVVGSKVTVTVQVALACSVMPQVVVSVKTLALPPLIVNKFSVIGALPLFVSVTDEGALLPLATLPKASVVEDNVNAGVDALAVPDSATVLLLPDVEFATIVRLALNAPAVSGVKVIVTAQLEPTARVLPQLLAIEKVEASGPLRLID